jgi:hypothetical protein
LTFSGGVFPFDERKRYAERRRRKKYDESEQAGFHDRPRPFITWSDSNIDQAFTDDSLQRRDSSLKTHPQSTEAGRGSVTAVEGQRTAAQIDFLRTGESLHKGTSNFTFRWTGENL